MFALYYPGASHWPAREYSRLSPMEAAIGDSPESQQCRPRRQDGGRPSQGGRKTVSLIQSLKFSNLKRKQVEW